MKRATVVLAVLGIAAAVLFFAAPTLGINGPTLARTWIARANGPWGLAAVVGAFAVLAFVGVPQVALIAAAVAILGPVRGGGYAWIATMISAMIGYGIGRAVGAASGLDDPRLARFLRWMEKNGLLASLGVRLVPLAPFALINIAAGAARIGVFDFVVGSALGIIPKITLTAFAGGMLADVFGAASP